MIELTDREKTIVAGTLAVGLVVGLWMGLLLLPAEALDVPTHEQSTGANGETSERAAFYPVPPMYFAVTIGAPLAALWYGYTRCSEPAEATDENVRDAITDGGHE